MGFPAIDSKKLMLPHFMLSLREFTVLSPIADRVKNGSAKHTAGTVRMPEKSQKATAVQPAVGEYEIKFPDKKAYAAFISKSKAHESPAYAADYSENVSLAATKEYINMHYRHKSPPDIGKRIGRTGFLVKDLLNRNSKSQIPAAANTRKAGAVKESFNKLKEGFKLVNENKELYIKLNAQVKAHMKNFQSLITHPPSY